MILEPRRFAESQNDVRWDEHRPDRNQKREDESEYDQDTGGEIGLGSSLAPSSEQDDRDDGE